LPRHIAPVAPATSIPYEPWSDARDECLCTGGDSRFGCFGSAEWRDGFLDVFIGPAKNGGPQSNVTSWAVDSRKAACSWDIAGSATPRRFPASLVPLRLDVPRYVSVRRSNQPLRWVQGLSYATVDTLA